MNKISISNIALAVLAIVIAAISTFLIFTSSIYNSYGCLGISDCVKFSSSPSLIFIGAALFLLVLFFSLKQDIHVIKKITYTIFCFLIFLTLVYLSMNNYIIVTNQYLQDKSLNNFSFSSSTIYWRDVQAYGIQKTVIPIGKYDSACEGVPYLIMKDGSTYLISSQTFRYTPTVFIDFLNDTIKLPKKVVLHDECTNDNF